MITALIIIIWIVCGILGYGITLAYFQRKYPMTAQEAYEADCGFSAAIAITGPLGLIVALASSGWVRHGFQWRDENMRMK